MKTIPLTFRSRGFAFTQLRRRGNFAAFRKVRIGGTAESFEAVRIRPHAAYVLAGVEIPAGESYPSAEKWGTDGFTFNDEDSAFRRMSEMEAA